MDTKSQYLLLIMGLIIIGSIVITYNRIVVLRDYEVLAYISCDPAREQCFVEEDGDQTYYYKIIHKQAKYITPCDPNEGECLEPSCTVGEAGCSVEYCDPATAEEEDVSCDTL